MITFEKGNSISDIFNVSEIFDCLVSLLKLPRLDEQGSSPATYVNSFSCTAVALSLLAQKIVFLLVFWSEKLKIDFFAWSAMFKDLRQYLYLLDTLDKTIYSQKLSISYVNLLFCKQIPQDERGIWSKLKAHDRKLNSSGSLCFHRTS
jgi:hypothetical protein